MRTALLGPDDLDRAAALLAAGELVAIPTETVYGLAGDARNPEAVARIYAAKERPSFDPLIVHVAIPERDVLDALDALGLVDAEALEETGRAAVRDLAREWPGPLTLVLPRGPAVPDLVTAGLDTVGIRVPAHPLAQALLRLTGPLAAPSANRFGRVSPTTARAVIDELDGRIAAVLDGGQCAVGVESTVVRVLPDGDLVLLRPGGTPRESLPSAREHDDEVLRAPGMTLRHYAPGTPVVLLPRRVDDEDESALDGLVGSLGPRVGLLRFAPGRAVPGVAAERTLSDGDVAEAARNLFAAMRELDALDLDALIAEPPPTETGLGHAIADRLRRAARRAP
jgi:L-threonylcarbamoyladenylate synthase